MTEKALDAKARRFARRAGFVAKKWRGRLGTVDNYGGFMLVDPMTNTVVYGARCELSPQKVIEICSERSGGWHDNRQK